MMLLKNSIILCFGLNLRCCLAADASADLMKQAAVKVAAKFQPQLNALKGRYATQLDTIEQQLIQMMADGKSESTAFKSFEAQSYSDRKNTFNFIFKNYQTSPYNKYRHGWQGKCLDGFHFHSDGVQVSDDLEGETINEDICVLNICTCTEMENNPQMKAATGAQCLNHGEDICVPICPTNQWFNKHINGCDTRGLTQVSQILEIVDGNSINKLTCVRYYRSRINTYSHQGGIDYCNSLGLAMVSIRSQAEQDVLTDEGSRFWISAKTNQIHDIKSGYSWDDGTPVSTFYWYAGEPNMYNNNEDCIELVGWQSRSGNWNDNDCATKYYPICEQRFC